MVVPASPKFARIAGLLRLALLTLVALHLAHDAVYVAHFGTGHDLASAMGERGHDAYWPAFTQAGIVAAAALGAFAIARFALLSRAAGRPMRIGGQPELVRPGYRPELARLWACLWALVIPLYVGLENLEAFVLSGDVLGFEPLAGAETRLALPIIALITFALAAAGALVRWRIRVLEARLAATSGGRWQPAPDEAPAVEWGPVGLLAANRWIAGRPDAGRAPPPVVASPS
jgi:hypothetical protein